MSLVNLLHKASSLNTAGITFIRSGESAEYISYHDLYTQSLSILGALQQKGVKAGDEVVLQTDNNRHFLLLFWACLLGKIIPVPLSAATPVMHKLKLLKIWPYLSNPFWVGEEQELQAVKAAVAAESAEAEFAQLHNKTLVIEDLLNNYQQGTPEIAAGEDIAYIQFSSGSTGDPKGVCLSHDNLLSNMAAISKSLAISSTDRLLSWMPLTHDMGLIGFHLVGVSQNIEAVSMATSLFIRRPLLWMEASAAYRASVLYAPNFAFHYFLHALEQRTDWNRDLSAIRIIVNGAEPVLPALCNRFINRLQQYGLREHAITTAYGLAEASLAVSVMPVETAMVVYCLNRMQLNIKDEVQEVPAINPEAVCFADVGYPVTDCQVRISDLAGSLLPENTIGEIQITGVNVTKGYRQNKKATNQTFTPDGWLKTGDLGFMRNGRLVITGRLKNLIIINGQNYYPQDIEQAVTNTGLVEPGKVVACSVRGNDAENATLAVFVLHKVSIHQFLPIAAAIRDIVFRSIGIHVNKVIPVRKIPKTTSGKIQYYLLADQYSRGMFDNEIGQLQRDDDIQVQGIDLLVQEARLLWGRNDIDTATNLFTIGINSFMAVQYSNRISLLTGKHIPAEALFQYNTLTLLNDFLTGERTMATLAALPAATTAEFIIPTLAQQRVWVECQLNPGSSAYNIPVVYSIKGELQLPALKEAFRQLVNRHAGLRTSFVMEQQELQHKVHAGNDHFSYSYIDLRSQANVTVKAAEICEETINTLFPLHTPGQWRVNVLQLADKEYLMVFVIHHILVDGWSLTILLNEWCTIYHNIIKQEPVLLPSAISFSSYCAWQQQLLVSETLSKERAYWRTELADLPTPVGLSLAEKHFHGNKHVPIEQHTHTFSGQLADNIQQMAAVYETTPFVIIMACLNILLYRYTNQRDIVTGFDVSGRLSPEMEQVVGYTLNTLCLRVSINGNESLEDIIRSVKKKLALALQHQLLPFEQVLAEQQGSHYTDGNPFFKILVLYQDFNERFPQLTLTGCEATRQNFYVKNGFVDVLLEFYMHHSKLELTVHYNRKVYANFAIQQLVTHFHRLLHESIDNSAVPIRHLNLLSPGEKEALLFPKESQKHIMQVNMPVHLIFQWRVTITPDETAIYSGENTLSYGQLNNKANAIAHLIINKYQLSPNDRIGFLVNRNEKIIIAILAILKVSAAYVAIDADLPTYRVQQIIRDSGMKLLIADGEYSDKLKEIYEPGFVLNIDQETNPAQAASNPAYRGNNNSLAYVVYTSGSTGAPKGVMIGHNTLCHYVQHFVRHFEVDKSDVFIQQSSVAFDTLVEEIFPALCTSAKIVIAPNGGKDVEGLLSLIEKHQVSILTATPLVIKEINNLALHRLSSLRLLISGGDRLQAASIDRLINKMTIYNTYGPAETTVCATYQAVIAAEDPIAIGQPLPGYNILILDENGELMPYGKTGEIYIEGGHAHGYLNQEKLTAEKFIVHPFDATKKLYRSGDYGYWNENGSLVFEGRLDSQVKIKGCRVEPGEVEAVIGNYPGVNAVAVVPAANREYLVAFISVDTPFSIGQLQRSLANGLPSYMVPQSIRVVDEIPRTVTGKTDRQQLSLLTANPSHQLQPLQEPQTTREQRVLDIIKKVLPCEAIGTNSNIFECGCNSIKAHQISNKIYGSEGIAVSIAELFSHPTIQQLCAWLDRSTINQEPVHVLDLE